MKRNIVAELDSIAGEGHGGILAPDSGVPEKPLDTLIPAGLLRGKLDLPSVPEVEVVRHFTLLSQLNYGVDSGFYPLGSCTMKFNPRVNERVAALPGMTGSPNVEL